MFAFDDVFSSSSGGNGTLSLVEVLARHTQLDKIERQYEPRSMDGNCDRGSSRDTPPSPVPTLCSEGKSTPVGGFTFPSDSTPLGNNVGVHGVYKSSPTANRRQLEEQDQGERSQGHYRDFRGEDQMQQRDASPRDAG
jgi:hypothetical protein